MKRSLFLIPLLLLSIGAAPIKPHPLQLIVPSPDAATRLAHFNTYPDETVVDKVKSLEQAVREANPNADEWSIYLTPRAATIVVKGWNSKDFPDLTPVPEATLGECLDYWLCRQVPVLFYKVDAGRILIDAKEENSILQTKK